jgi:rhodanese-related sulfurtransferase
MAAFAAGNHAGGFSPVILAQDFEAFILNHEAIVFDVRDPISFKKAALRGSNNYSQQVLRENLDRIPKDHPILLISDDGQKGHVVLRMLKGSGFDQVFNLSGGYISLERHARAIGYEHLDVGMYPVEHKSVEDLESFGKAGTPAESDAQEDLLASDGPLVLDVRTPMEFAMGAFPGAVNVGLDELAQWSQGVKDKNRHIIVYCASGARSSYGMRILKQQGFTNVENGGGLHTMMARRA